MENLERELGNLFKATPSEGKSGGMTLREECFDWVCEATKALRETIRKVEVSFDGRLKRVEDLQRRVEALERRLESGK